MKYNQMKMDEVINDYRAPFCVPIYKEPTPSIKLVGNVKKGYYARLKNGNVFRVDEIGSMRLEKYYIDCKRRDGSHYKKAQIKEIQTYISDVFYDGKASFEYFSVDDVVECHKNLIDCIYKNDRIIDKKGRLFEVKSKVISKTSIFLICDYGNEEIRINNYDISKKCMTEKIEVRNLEIGEKIFCKRHGWVTVYRIWSKKIQAYSADKNVLFFVYEWDILKTEN